jgi:hypothetical protein
MHRHDEEICGEAYDHQLRVIGSRDGLTTYECLRCGAEIVDEDEPADAAT